MSLYDGMEPVFLQCGRDTPRRGGLQGHPHGIAISTRNISKLWGQFQVWAILFLLVSPASSKPIQPASKYIHQSPNNTNQERQKSSQPSSPAVRANKQQKQLTTEQFSPLNSQHLFSEINARPFVHSFSGSNLPSSEQNSLSIISNNLRLENSPIDDSKIASVYKPQYKNKVFSFINKKGENLLEKHKEIDNSVSLRTVKDSNRINKKTIKNSNTISKSLGDKRRASLDPKPFKILTKLRTLPEREAEPTSRTVQTLEKQERLFPSVVAISKSSSRSALQQSSQITPTLASAGDGNTVLSTVISRVQRHTAEPSKLEGFAFEAGLRNPSSGGGGTMDSTDDARNGRGSNGGSSGSTTNTAHWSLPCKIDTAANPMSSPSYLSDPIYNSVNLAHKHGQDFKASFASQMWDGLDWESAITLVPDDKYKFLNRLSIPSEEELKTIKFNDILRIAYESMQRRAVSIEQVTLDQALYRDFNNTDFLSQFRIIEGEIVNILCELHYAMMQQGVTPSETITADIMEGKYRDIDSSSGRLTRDTIILREYLNGLDYLMVVFEYFKSQAT